MPTPIGRIVDPENLFGRHRELERVWKLVADGNNVLIPAPRRVGKSSLLHRLEYEAREKGWLPVRITLPDCETEVQFVKRLLEASWAEDHQKPWHKSLADSAAGKILERIRVGETELKPEEPRDWEALSGSVTAMMKASKESKLFLVDELPLFVADLLKLDAGRQRAKRFLGWMKTMREDTRHRWVMAGSIGLDQVARRAQLTGTIADIFLYNEFGPFDRDTAEAFLRKEARERRWEVPDEAVNEALRLTADYHVPYYLALLSEEMYTCHHERRAFSAGKLLDRRTSFSHWDERLDDIFGAGTRDRVDEVLARASRGGKGILRDEALSIAGPRDGKELLEVLVNDGYLRLDGDRYAFRCEIVRLYWERYVTA